MKKQISIACTLVSMSITVFAQDETDILRFSAQQSGTTARSIALGGALGSIGADFGAIGVNPASLGRYSKDEISFTPAFNAINAPSTFLGTDNVATRNKLGINNIGFVSARRDERNRSSWRNVAFAIGMNSNEKLTQNYNYSGITQHSSIANAVAKRINASGGMNYINSGSAYVEDVMMYNMFVVDRDVNNTTQVKSYVPLTSLRQSQNVQEIGALNELAVALGGNLKDRLLLGVTVGIPFANYTNLSVIREEDASGNALNEFSYLQQSTYRITSGIGINARLGAIFLANEGRLRLGIAAHTPTALSLTDNYRFAIEANVENLNTGVGNQLSEGSISSDDPQTSLISQYAVRTPWKALISGGIVFGKSGLLTADVDLVDYRSARINFQDDATYSAQINDVVRNEMRMTQNLRLGTEWRVGNISYRAGVAHNGSPYASSSKYMRSPRTQLSLGVGFRSTSFFIDLSGAYATQTRSDYAYVYEVAGALNPSAKVAKNAIMGVLTIGWKY